MKSNLYLFLIIAVLLGSVTLVSAQQTTRGQVSVRLKEGVNIVFTSITDPPVAGRQTMGNIQVGGKDNVMHRAFIDAERSVYFGYDLKVEPTGESGQFKLTFKPLSVPPSRAGKSLVTRGGGVSSSNNNRQTVPLTALILPKYPEPQIVADGDTLALDVLVNPQTGVKIIDLIKVSTSGDPRIELPATGSQGASRGGSSNSIKETVDLTVEAVEMKITASQLLVNGQPAIGGSADSRSGVSGALIWFYLPGRGRFILSLAPRAGYGFQKAGTVEGNRAAFELDGVRYDWISAARIVAGADNRWSLWVRHDPDYRPDFELSREFPYQIGAADRVEYLIRKK